MGSDGGWVRSVISFAVAAALAYLAVCAFLWVFQDHLLFHPRALAHSPKHSAASAVAIERPDAVLRGWVVNGERVGPLVVYFGGNAEEVSGNIDFFADRNATTVLVNYRGYGESSGSPSERRLVADAVAVVEWARERYPNRPLVLFGSSLGTGVAALAAAEVRPDAAILVSPYRSVERLARQRFPIFPVRWILRHPFRAEAAAASMPPTLVIASNVDGVIPIAESEAMVRAMRDAEGGPPVEVRTIDVPHGYFPGRPEFWRAVDDYLAGVSRS